MLAQKPYFPAVPQAIRELFASEGLALIGITDADDSPESEARYSQWIAEGHHGDMGYLADHAGLKYRPGRILPGCRSILSVGCNYYQPASWPAGRPLSSSDVPDGRVARYAWGRDYHRALGKRLSRIVKQLRLHYPDSEFRPFTDATPLSERHYGEAAGVGFTGRNTLLINGQYGSWFFVGEVLSTKPFPSGEPAAGRHGACPRSCRRCIDVCPTGALEAPNVIDGRRCISYLTIEHSGSIPEELRPGIGDWLFGCDLCQEVCPLNVRATVTDLADFTAWRAGPRLELEGIMNIASRDEFVSRFAGTPLMRPGRVGLIRNACVVAGNRRDPALTGTLARLAGDGNAVLREHARWALNRLEKTTT